MVKCVSVVPSFQLQKTTLVIDGDYFRRDWKNVVSTCWRAWSHQEQHAPVLWFEVHCAQNDLMAKGLKRMQLA